MSCKVEWGDKAQNVILVSYPERVTSDEFTDCLRVQREFFASIDHKAHLIIDMSQIVVLPPQLLGRSQLLYTHSRENVGLHIVVATNIVIRATINLIAVVDGRVQLVSTLEEARAILDQVEQMALSHSAGSNL